MKDILKPYAELVKFLGIVLGPDYEVALHDVGEENCIVAIANGHVSGRDVGAPLTNKAKQFLQDQIYERENWELNYLGVSREGTPLRSSTYFIRDADGGIAGMLCVNFDDSRYRQMLLQVLRLCHPDEFLDAHEGISYAPSLLLTQNAAAEQFPGTAEDAVSETVSQVLAATHYPVEKMTQDEKTEVVDKLNRRGVFAIKGAVSTVARALSSSEATIYRYLARVRRSGEEQAPSASP